MFVPELLELYMCGNIYIIYIYIYISEDGVLSSKSAVGLRP